MANDLEPVAVDSDIEKVLVGGDLSGLSPLQRTQYVGAVCKSLGLNPLTRPFEYLRLNGKLVLYAKRDATEQLRKVHGVSVHDMEHTTQDDVYVVKVKATDRTGRTDQSLGAVPINGLKGEALANAMMKAETKAKRRVTLSICGLGLLDETEVSSIPGVQLAGGEQTAARFDALGPVADPPATFLAGGTGEYHQEPRHNDNPSAATTGNGNGAEATESQPAMDGTATPLRPVSFRLNGMNYETAGIKRDTFVKLHELGRAYNKKHGKGAAGRLQRETLLVETSLDLTEEAGQQLCALLEFDPKVVTA